MFSSINALDLARFQFAFTVSFHIIFPALTIGLASFLAVLEGLWLKTRNDTYIRLFNFWVKIFAVAFGLGVVSGVVMSYQIGTNWSGFSNFAGPITGPLLSYEVLTAFFLEAGFLGIMIFGRGRVSEKAHFVATLMVAVGTLISSFWILASNSWMQTPQGYEIVGNRVIPLDWLAIIFNPSFPYRLFHMVIAAYICSAFTIAAVAAYHLIKGRRESSIKTMFSMALGLLLVLVPVQILVGDAHGINTRDYQPVKLAAMEGSWNKQVDGTGFYLFGWPDMEARKTRYAVEIPYLGSLILTRSLKGELPALNDYPREDWPNVPLVFWSFRVMVGIGMIMLMVVLAAFVLKRRQRLYSARWFHRLTLLMGPSGYIALLAGWITTEAGRQPWVIYGIKRTADAVSPITFAQVSTSLVAFAIVYFIVFGIGIYYLLRMMKIGPDAHGPEQPPQPENKDMLNVQQTKYGSPTLDNRHIA